MNEQMENALVALKNNGYEVYYAENKKEARDLVLELLTEGESVTLGGSVTVNGLEDLLPVLREGPYELLDRYAPELDKAGVREVLLDGGRADVLLTSSNAVTEEGELYNVDGNGNRCAQLCFGPKKVIVIAGRNKIVPDLEAAILRVKNTAAPMNAVRLGRKTYCRENGHCLSVDEGKGSVMTAGCKSPDRMCLKYLVMGLQREAGRVKVILVDEDLGY